MDGDGKAQGTECACPRCLICKELLQGEQEEVETLPCMHALHKKCLDRYCEISGKARADCCPLKCSVSGATDTFLSLATSSQTSQVESQIQAENVGITEDADSELEEDTD